MENLNVGTYDGHRIFTLSTAVVTSTQAIIARKRSGKSYTADVQAEEMLKHKQQVGIIDPTGAHYGLRASADGKSEGYAIVVFGGDHADAPLDWRAGREMALAFIKHGFSAIWDISNFDTEEQIVFVNDLCRELLKSNREAVHIFIDEADTYAPQMLESKAQKVCLGSVRRLVKQGGVRGVGVTLITQRSSDLSKSVLSQVDIMVALTVSHPPDIAPIVEWVSANVGAEEAASIKSEMPKLVIGEAFFCSRGSMKRVKVRLRETFNSGATPKPGERKVEPKVLAAIDMKQLGQKIAESVAEAKANMPEALKQKIVELEKQIAKGGAPTMELQKHIAELERKAAEVEPLRSQVAQLEAGVTGANERARIAMSFLQEIAEVMRKASTIVGESKPVVMAVITRPTQASILRETQATYTPSPTTYAVSKPSKDGDLTSRILRTLAEFESIGRMEIERNILSGWAGARGGYFKDTVSSMKTKGLLHYPSAGTVALTTDGRSKAPAIDTPPDASSFFEAVVRQVGTGGLPERIMRRLRTDYPDGLGRDELSEAVGAKGGYYKDTVSSLKSAGFIEYPRQGQVRLQSWTVME